MTSGGELTEIWAKNHREGRYAANAFVCGILAIKEGGCLSLRPEESAAGEESAIVAGLVLGARSVYEAVLTLPEADYLYAGAFGNAALGKLFDVLTDAFDVPDCDLDFGEIRDALDRANLFGCGPLELDERLLTDLARCSSPVFDFDRMTARSEGIRACALAIRSARVKRIEAREWAYRGGDDDDDDGGKGEGDE